MKKASAAHVIAKNWTEAERFKPKSAYATLPSPIPSKATARINPNENVDPPRSGPSIRYQTISMRKKAKPTRPAAQNTKIGFVVAPDSSCSDSAGDSKPGFRSGIDLER